MQRKLPASTAAQPLARSQRRLESTNQLQPAQPGESTTAPDPALQFKQAARLGHHAGGFSIKAGEQRPAQDRSGLPDDLKAGIERLSGMALDDVSVHYNSPAPARLDALAYTQGRDIHVAPGQERHLAHEAWHIVQQQQGRVRPTMRLQGQGINDDAGLEREADTMGARATGEQPRNDAAGQEQHAAGCGCAACSPATAAPSSGSDVSGAIVQRVKCHICNKDHAPGPCPPSPQATPRNDQLFVGQRPAFGAAGRILGLTHSALMSEDKNVSLGNSPTEPSSNYQNRYPVQLPTNVTPQQVQATAEKNIASRPTNPALAFAKYVGAGKPGESGVCNDVVADSLKAHGVPLPEGMRYQGVHNPQVSQNFENRLREGVDQATSQGEMGGAHPVISGLKALTDPNLVVKNKEKEKKQ